MTAKYKSFADLPLDVSERLKKKIIVGEEATYTKIEEGLSIEELMEAHRKAFQNPSYTEQELGEIIDAFVRFNNAVKRGLPNQVYEMFCRALDSKIAYQGHAKNAIWYAHGDERLAVEAVKDWSDGVIREIKKRRKWDEGKFHDEYFLK